MSRSRWSASDTWSRLTCGPSTSRCGRDPETSGTWYGGTSDVSPFPAPDNLTSDSVGNLWRSTDGMPDNLPGNDGISAVPTECEERGRSLRFFSSVPGAECSGPVFTTDNTSFFVAVQHPGEGGTLEDPVSLWPDGAVAPRPSVVVISAQDGIGRVGRLG